MLTTEEREGRKAFLLRSRRVSGKQQGRLQELAAARAASTVLSSVTTVDYTLLSAVRREVASWRLLQLDAAALRLPSVTGTVGDGLQTDGGNLAWVLHLIDDERGLDEVASDLSRVIRDFSAIEVHANEARGQWEVYLRSVEEGTTSARVASDGTLRLLALLAALRTCLRGC